VVVDPGTDVVVELGLVVVVVGGAQVGRVTVLLSRVTAPLRARRRPWMFAPEVAVIEVRARIVPTKVELVPSVAELPTCQ
jgi:hypothetical protein